MNNRSSLVVVLALAGLLHISADASAGLTPAEDEPVLPVAVQRVQIVPMFVPNEEAGMYSVDVQVTSLGAALAFACFAATGTKYQRGLFDLNLVSEAHCLFVDPSGFAMFLRVPVSKPVRA